jgi:hypothetical protein
MINQKFKNSTRNQIVQVTKRGYNVHKTEDTEVSAGVKVQYTVIEATSNNPFNEFVCTEERFNRLYETI